MTASLVRERAGVTHVSFVASEATTNGERINAQVRASSAWQSTLASASNPVVSSALMEAGGKQTAKYRENIDGAAAAGTILAEKQLRLARGGH